MTTFKFKILFFIAFSLSTLSAEIVIFPNSNFGKQILYGEASIGLGSYTYIEPGNYVINLINNINIKGKPIMLNGKLGHRFLRIFAHEINLDYMMKNDNNTYTGADATITNVGGVSVTNFEKTTKKSSDMGYSGEYKLGINLRPKGDSLTYNDFIYAGIGYRYLSNQIENSTKREQVYNYIPIGYEARQKIYGGLYFRFNFEYRHFLKGIHTIHTGMTGFNEPKVTLNQDKGYGYKAMIGVEYDYKNIAYVFLRAVYDYWYVEESKDVVTITHPSIANPQNPEEPYNNTSNLIVQFGLGF